MRGLCENCIHYGVCVVNSYCHEPCGYYEEERPHGEWKTACLDHAYFGVRPKVIYCSNCNSVVSHKANFCEECGSDNRKKGDSE